MRKFALPGVGMRTIKTAVAVMISYLLFVPLELWWGAEATGILAHLGPAYACIACIICMQSSMGQSIELGLSRLTGVAVGGVLGVLILTAEVLLTHPLLKALMLGLACVAGVWVCMLIRRPAACVMACILPCVVVINETTGVDRYYYAAARILETVVGIAVALAVNALLPNRRAEGKPDGKGESPCK